MKDYDFTLGEVYEVGGISRQGYHQLAKRQKDKTLVDTRLVELTKEIRKDHPRMGARKLFEPKLSDSRIHLSFIFCDCYFLINRKEIYCLSGQNIGRLL